ncbi:MAG: SMP-30/gluconolactonase/LRE family protein [Rhizobiaceae bacterium]|nr:SMP-30/gluconolactonase/LRE family protein [Rhizobiaceae bacterium]
MKHANVSLAGLRRMMQEMRAQSWTDNAAPLVILVLVTAAISSTTSGFFDSSNLGDTFRQLGETALMVIGMMIVIAGGGIDLSIGSTFALSNVVVLLLLNVFEWPLWLSVAATISVCGAVGLVNGLLVGFLRLPAFLTTLATLIVVRAVVNRILLDYAQPISGGTYDSDAWTFLGDGNLAGIPVSAVILAAVAVLAHIMLTRLRPGWNIMAVGGSRRAAHNAGIPVRATVCSTYVISGILCGIAGTLYAARLNGTGSDTGVGLEVSVLTAAVLGGNALGGGRGSVAKALIGAAIMVVLTNGMVHLGMPGGAASAVFGLVLLLAVIMDVRWVRRRENVESDTIVAPVAVNLEGADRRALEKAPAGDFKDVGRMEAGGADGPAGIAFDTAGNLYAGMRQGQIVRFMAPGFEKSEVFAHIGGYPRGLTFDAEGRLLACVSGMGIYSVAADRTVEKVVDRVKGRIPGSGVALRSPADLVALPDGRILFTEFSRRFGQEDWVSDLLEGQGHGALMTFDPKTEATTVILGGLRGPTGLCLSHDGRSVLLAESWASRIIRIRLDGGQAQETVVEDLPGYPVGLRPAEDGYWVSFLGMRSTVLDIAMSMPSFREGMIEEMASGEWLYPNVNVGCILRIDESGHVQQTLWDESGSAQSMICGLAERQGELYVASTTSKGLSRIAVQPAAGKARRRGARAVTA